MIKTYKFCEGTIEFDDAKSVRELIHYAFDQFDYYEPFGMDIVTLFQCHHSASNTGWFTTDLDRSCAEEIEDGDWLCFAYHMPGVFNYAEGGWGHHMRSLGNHPELTDPTPLHLRFEDFDHTVVFNGKYTFREIVRLFQNAGYIPEDAHMLVIRAINPYQDPYCIFFSDAILDADLVRFEQALPNAATIIDIK